MLRASVVLGVAIVAATVHAPAAQAQHGAAPGAPPPAPRVETRWYGWQILAVDVASAATLASGGGDLTWGLGIGGLVLGGPAIHVLHGQRGRAAGSLALRVGAPLVGGLLMSATCDERGRDQTLGCLGEIAWGVLIGAGVALAFDLARANDVVEVGPAVAPTVIVTGGGAQLAVLGRF